jgi:hypothetical protein
VSAVAAAALLRRTFGSDADVPEAALYGVAGAVGGHVESEAIGHPSAGGSAITTQLRAAIGTDLLDEGAVGVTVGATHRPHSGLTAAPCRLAHESRLVLSLGGLQ